MQEDCSGRKTRQKSAPSGVETAPKRPIFDQNGQFLTKNAIFGYWRPGRPQMACASWTNGGKHWNTCRRTVLDAKLVRKVLIWNIINSKIGSDKDNNSLIMCSGKQLLLLLLSIYFLNWSSHFQKKDQFNMFNIIELKNRTDRELSVKNKQVKYLIHSVKHDLRQNLCNWRKFKLAQDGFRFRDKWQNVDFRWQSEVKCINRSIYRETT